MLCTQLTSIQSHNHDHNWLHGARFYLAGKQHENFNNTIKNATQSEPLQLPQDQEYLAPTKYFIVCYAHLTPLPFVR